VGKIPEVFMKRLFVAILALAISPAAFAEGSCSKAQVMAAVHKAYGPEFKYASNNAGDAEAGPTFVQHENNDQYVFWVDKVGNTFKAVVTSDSGSCTHLRAFVDLQNGQ
jgi:hypothetical protein